MTAYAKIRLLLALIFASLLLTAIVVKKTYTPKTNLDQSGRALEKSIRDKENYVNSILSNKAAFEDLKTLDKNEVKAIALIENLTTINRIWLAIETGSKLTFWSGVKILPTANQPIKEGRSFIKRPNGYFEAIKKTEGNFDAIFFIPVKSKYLFENKYLKNTFDEGLPGGNLELADFTDKDVYNIHSIDNQYLFSVKAVPDQINYKFYFFISTLWILSFLFLCLLINSLCKCVARKGRLVLSFILLAAFIIGLRILNLNYHWPGYASESKIFNPVYYSAGLLFPSLGDFCINLLMLLWFVAFVYGYRFKLMKPVESKTVGYIIIAACVVFLLVILATFVNIFYGLVVTSKINFDVNNVLNLSALSLIGVVMVCFAFLIFNLIDEILLVIVMRIKIPVAHKFIIFALGVIAITIFYSLRGPFTPFFVLAGFVTILRAYVVWYRDSTMDASIFISFVILTALIASVKLNAFQTVREHEQRKMLVKKLQTADDATADHIFKVMEKDMGTDPFLIKYFNDSTHNSTYLRMHFKKEYFDGYLSKYDFKIYEFDNAGKSISDDKTYILDNFKDMVLYSAFKVSNFFYRENDSFGFQSYFALLPVIYKGESLGTFVIALKSKPLQVTSSFPELLVDQQFDLNNEFKDYSYAFYSDDDLISQNGSYTYGLVNAEFKVKSKTFSFTNSPLLNSDWYNPYARYSHLIYKPSNRKTIVVSRQEFPVLYGATSLTFFFVLMLIFNASVMLLRWVWVRVKFISIAENHVRWSMSINFSRILYKTRIQFSIISAVVFTLFLVGIITYLSLRTQYLEQQQHSVSDRLVRITSAFENLIDNKSGPLNQETQVGFNTFADAYATDLTLYNLNGDMLYTTQPKLYSMGLIMPKMNGRAYIFLNRLQKSELVSSERIANLTYIAGYAPIRNNKSQTIGYLQLPFFSNEAEYTERIGSLFNAMINIYALIFIVIGLFAILVARQITNPLSFIQQSISKTIYGEKNEPIVWSRNDEIGALVREYNNMIAELELSAGRLAQSERESAWREMAKQVAHEIKNPLTPLKLGLQLLEKSWRDKDPKFDAKFERFSKSFVEQIESLSSIASEFSAFAKMPDTRMQRMDVVELISQAVTVFKHMDNVNIKFNAPATPFYIVADRDQLLRCFNNLLKNAIEAMPIDRAGLIDIDYTIEDRAILINVRDNGNGIPANLRTKIFEPNFTTKSSGTGLGLAFVKNSVENAGGKVWFETQLGVGTVFHLHLPQTT